MSAKQDEGEDELPTLEELLNANLRRRVRPKQKPTLVTDGGKIAGSASVHLHPSDPNWRGSASQYVRVLDRWDDDGPRVVWSYHPFEVLGKGPRYHD
jgi:hypothetical protein